MKTQRRIRLATRQAAGFQEQRSPASEKSWLRRWPTGILFSVLLSGALLMLLSSSARPAGDAGALATRTPEAIVDLATTEGMRAVNGTWRYSDTKIVEVEFRTAGPDGQPTGAPNKAYDLEPHAGGAHFDDSGWEVIDPVSLPGRRSPGRLAFNWYRIRITVPERIGSFDPTGSTVVFATSVDDYAEIWVDGELPRAPGQSGGSVVMGWNAENRLIAARNVKPGQKIQLAIFGINGPLSNPPTNYIYIRHARLEFHRVPAGPVALLPQEVNVEVVRLNPAIDTIVPPNPKLYKLAEGFGFAVRPVWSSDEGLIFTDADANRTYRYAPDGNLSKLEDNGASSDSGRIAQPRAHPTARSPDGKYLYAAGTDWGRKIILRHETGDETQAATSTIFFDMSGAGGEEDIDGIEVDRDGNLYVAGPGGIRVISPAGAHLGTIRGPRQPRGMAWGGEDGKTLYLTAGSALYRMPFGIPGVPQQDRVAGASLGSRTE